MRSVKGIKLITAALFTLVVLVLALAGRPAAGAGVESSGGPVGNSNLLTKQIAAPPADFASLSLPNPADLGIRSRSALIPVELNQTAGGQWHWSGELRVDEGQGLSLMVLAPEGEQWAVTLTSPGGQTIALNNPAEGIQRQAGVPEARAVIVSLRRDDTGVLTVLTARNLAPKARIIASCREGENAKLLQRSGADVIVSAATVGGYLMADAVDSAYTVALINDMLTERGRVRLSERTPLPEEVGKGPRELECLVIGLEREGQRIGFWDAEGLTLRPDDLLLVIEPNTPAAS